MVMLVVFSTDLFAQVPKPAPTPAPKAKVARPKWPGPSK